ncbi:MAG: type II toxin-antitoxin system RelE/ParE family toxin [Bryobacteraceae bacterium]|jgi:toxin ParE1/3/4
MKRYVLTGSAKRDLDEIWIDIAERSRSIETAERMLWLLYRKILSLAKFSGTGRRCDDIDEGGRCAPAGNYIIYYRPTSSGIAVTHIFHGARDQTKAWRNLPVKSKRK